MDGDFSPSEVEAVERAGRLVAEILTMGTRYHVGGNGLQEMSWGGAGWAARHGPGMVRGEGEGGVKPNRRFALIPLHDFSNEQPSGSPVLPVRSGVEWSGQDRRGWSRGLWRMREGWITGRGRGGG